MRCFKSFCYVIGVSINSRQGSTTVYIFSMRCVGNILSRLLLLWPYTLPHLTFSQQVSLTPPTPLDSLALTLVPIHNHTIWLSDWLHNYTHEDWLRTWSRSEIFIDAWEILRCEFRMLLDWSAIQCLCEFTKRQCTVVFFCNFGCQPHILQVHYNQSWCHRYSWWHNSPPWT